MGSEAEIEIACFISLSPISLHYKQIYFIQKCDQSGTRDTLSPVQISNKSCLRDTHLFLGRRGVKAGSQDVSDYCRRRRGYCIHYLPGVHRSWVTSGLEHAQKRLGGLSQVDGQRFHLNERTRAIKNCRHGEHGISTFKPKCRPRF